jgi:hypothetical protein
VVAAHLLLCWPGVVDLYVRQPGGRIEGAVWGAALGRRPDPDSAEMARLIEQRVPKGEAVFTAEIETGADGGRGIRETMLRAVVPELRPATRQVLSFTEVSARRVRAVQRPAHMAPLVVAEMRVFRGATELVRDPGWRLAASPNPGQVQAAFDNSPLTAWTTGGPAWRGAWIEIDFGSEQRCDRIELDLPANAVWTSPRVETTGRRRWWHGVPATSALRQVSWPGGMRWAAAQELKSQGVHWISARDGDPLAEDLANRWGLWGISAVARAGAWRLWRLE